MTIGKSSSKQEPELKFMSVFTDQDGLQIHEREHPDAEARFAMDLLRQHGVLMGTPAGEDSAGRAKIGIMPPAEVVSRALDISQAFHAEARKRGCMLLLPSTAEITEGVNEARKAATAAKEARREKAGADT
jgi:hypothetical protein